jgi:hypothetical protein
MARSRASAARRELNVPRFLRLPVLALFLREYKRYWPDFILRIMVKFSRCETLLRRQRAPCLFVLVRLAFTAERWRAADPLLRAAVRACLDRALVEAAE